MKILVFDIGGTHLRAGYFQGRRLLRHVTMTTPRSYRAGWRALVGAAAEVLNDRQPDRVVLGIAGVLDPHQQRLAAAPNLPGWVQQPLARDAQRHWRVPVRLANDATVAALGESEFGAGRGSRHCAYVAIGTGIGGTVLVDGHPIGATNTEPGHQYVTARRTWESVCGGKALQRRFGADWSCWSAKDWRWIEEQIAVGLVNCTTLWSPDRIVLGGALLRHRSVKLPRLTQHMKRLLVTIPTPKLVRVQLGDSAGLWGGLALLKRG